MILTLIDNFKDHVTEYFMIKAAFTIIWLYSALCSGFGFTLAGQGWRVEAAAAKAAAKVNL